MGTDVLAANCAGMKIGRNDPCPCGSGKKYKRCCLESSDVRSIREIQPELVSRGLDVHPYVVARMAESTRGVRDPRLRGKMEQMLRTTWTIGRVAAMTTEAIVEQLRQIGVQPDRERFLALAASHWSACEVADIWFARDPGTGRGKDEDFKLLAACELWKRWIPDRPSMEMLDDWMQEGYALMEARRPNDVCERWWKVWEVLRSRFTPQMTTCEATRPLFNGMQCLFNWSQDFEMELGNAALQDPHWLEVGMRYLREFLDQFTEEDKHLRGNLERSLAELLMQAGEREEAQRILLRRVDNDATDIWNYVALADAYSHDGRRSLGRDLDVAEEWIRRGKAQGLQSDEDRELLDERLEQVRRLREGGA